MSMTKILQSNRWRPFLAAFCAVGWSLAYPFIKLGYGELQIAGDDLGSKILFAGIRFALAGMMVLLICKVQKRNLRFGGCVEEGSDEKTKGPLYNSVFQVLVFSLVNTTLHYLFSYVGLGYLPSSRSAIIDSTGGFMLIILSCLIFADDKFTHWKAIGCILGFAGVLCINLGSGDMLSGGFSFRGDGMIFLNALCGAFGGIITRWISKGKDMFVVTGQSMLTGGAVLVLAGLLVGPAAPWNLSFAGIAILLLLSLISAVCFGIYNQLLSFHPISKVAIFTALIPVLGVFFACLILGEPLRLQYVAAGLLVAAGVALVNLKKGA